MTTCPERERLLDADKDALEGEEWRSHLDACGECAGAARRLTSAYGALDAALGTAAPVDAAAILARARVTVSGTERKGGRTTQLVLLAAAACIAGLLVLREWERPLPGTPFVSSAEAPVEWALEGDRDVAVLHTDNPDITVLWFFSGE